jgi:hypothetical protein
MSGAPLLGSAPKLEERNFRWAAVTHRQNHGAEAASDVNLSITLAAQTTQQTAAWPARSASLRAPRNLSTVGMTT